MSLESLTSAFVSRAQAADALGSTIKFVFTDTEGVIYLDGTANNAVSNEDRDAECTVHVASADLAEMMAGNLNPMMAFMTGKLRIEGDMGVAMKLGNVVG
ncbi:MAG: SCP2 sterol-binding domain-containing protein [Bacteroidia bacterium]|nr:SCP2 sterol-binding domain-containing protein [Bacteroidia bacterium]